MTKRRRFSEADVIKVLLFQGVEICCYRCERNFTTADEDIEREHVCELALGGKDEPINCAYSHKDCHKVITDGTKATSAGSSKHKIAKDKRLRTGKMTIKKGRAMKPKTTAWTKRVRAWPKGRALHTKGFVKI